MVRASRAARSPCAPLARCAREGSRSSRITMTVPDALAVMHEITSRMGSDVLVGAGTVLTADAARGCIEAGAQFIVSPGLDLEVIRAARRARGRRSSRGAHPDRGDRRVERRRRRGEGVPVLRDGRREVPARAARAAPAREAAADRRGSTSPPRASSSRPAPSRSASAVSSSTPPRSRPAATRSSRSAHGSSCPWSGPRGPGSEERA